MDDIGKIAALIHIIESIGTKFPNLQNISNWARTELAKIEADLKPKEIKVAEPEPVEEPVEQPDTAAKPATDGNGTEVERRV